MTAEPRQGPPVMNGPVVTVGAATLPAAILTDALELYAETALDREGERRRRGLTSPRPVPSWLISEFVEALKVSGAAHIRAGSLPEPPRVPLSRWCNLNSIPAATARRWASTGQLETATKTGTVWTVAATQTPARRTPR